MSKTLAEMQRSMAEKLQQRINNSQNGGTTNTRPRDVQEVNLLSIKPNEEVKIRFVDDGDSTNEFFWRANASHTLCFRGVKGDDSKKNVITYVNVPAYNTTVNKTTGKPIPDPENQLYVPKESVYTNEEDPIHAYSRNNKLFENKDTMRFVLPTGQEDALFAILGRRVSYLFQGYIVSAPESVRIFNGEGVRLLKHFALPKALYKKIYNHTFNSDTIEMNDNPIGNEDGVDFNIRKKEVNGFNNYDESTFSRRHTALSQDCMNDYVTYGPDSIADRCYKKPTPEQIEIIKQMLEAFLGHMPYDPAWDQPGWNKFTKELADEVADEPNWNSPTISTSSAQTSMEVAQAVTAELIADISGQPVAQPTAQQPVVQPAAPAQPAPAPQSSSTAQTPDDVLKFLQSKNVIQ